MCRRRRHEGGEALVAERVAAETEILQRGQPPQGRREGHQPRVADGGVVQREGLEPRQGASAQGGGQCRGACVAHMHIRTEEGHGRQRARAQPLRQPLQVRQSSSSSCWRRACLNCIIRGKTGYTHSLSPSRPPNNTLNTQSRAQQTHSRSRSLRAHPRSADPPSVMPRAARLGRRSRACSTLTPTKLVHRLLQRRRGTEWNPRVDAADGERAVGVRAVVHAERPHVVAPLRLDELAEDVLVPAGGEPVQGKAQTCESQTCLGSAGPGFEPSVAYPTTPSTC
eukprot:scaffold69793_cov55-Phaeocystis_antarctica.AAC.1